MPNSTIPSEEELLSKLRVQEDAFVERKLLSDTDDWLRTAVAFANTCPLGTFGILFVGVKNDGTIQGTENIESVQNKLSRKINEAFPQIYYHLKVLQKDGKRFLAAIIAGSRERPHFSGKALIRQGSSNIEASENLFTELVAQRSSKAYSILQWKGKPITVERRNVERTAVVGETAGYFEATVDGCDSQAVKLRSQNGIQTFPLERVRISHDDQKGRLKLEVYPF